MNWLRRVFLRRRVYDDLSAEIREHLEEKMEELVASGMPRRDAEAAARREFGNVTLLEERSREVWQWPRMESFFADIRYGMRMLRKSPGSTAVAVLTLALGIGANTAIFSVVDDILLKPLAYPDSERIVTITGETTSDNSGLELSLPESADIAAQNHVFEDVAADEYQDGWLLNHGAPEVLDAERVTGDYFRLLGIKVLLGRPILPADTESGHGKVAVLSYPLWRDKFGGDPGIAGKTITLSQFGGAPTASEYTVIGVLRATFGSSGGGSAKEVWVPLVPKPNERSDRMWRDKEVLARMKKGVTLEQVNSDLRVLSNDFAKEYPKTNKDIYLHAERLQDSIVKSARTALLVLLGAVGFVLLIACVNVSGLALARGLGRRREVAIREALGASRLRIVRQFLVESLLLALAGGAMGFFLAIWGVNILRSTAPSDTPRLDQLQFSPTVFWYALGISLLVGILFGLAPAIQVSSGKLDPELKGPGSTWLPALETRRPQRLRGVLVIAEVALTFVLLAGSALAIRSFAKLTTVNLGFRTDHVLAMWVDLSPATCKNEGPCFAFKQILQRVRTLPAVESAAFLSGSPLQGGYVTYDFSIQGQPMPAPGQEGPSAEYLAVSREYFRAMGMRLLAGRDFSKQDAKGAPLVAVVNQAFARRYFSGAAIGKKIATAVSHDKQPIWTEIVGEVNDARDIAPQTEPRPELHLPFAQANTYPSGELIVRTASDPMRIATAARQAVWAVDRNAPISYLKTLDQAASQAISQPRFRVILLGAFGGLAIILALVGISGTITYSVTQRTHEIGVRMALGAQPENILWLVTSKEILQALAGIGIGIGGGLGLTRFLGSLLFDIRPNDPMTFIGVAVLLMIVALAACYVPARRAMRVDPLVALRYE
jgi:putative ABC transport system permease protein